MEYVFESQLKCIDVGNLAYQFIKTQLVSTVTQNSQRHTGG